MYVSQISQQNLNLKYLEIDYTCILVPGGKTTGLLIKLMYMLGVTVKVTVISRLLTAERYTGMDSLLGKFSSVNVNLALKKPRRAEMKSHIILSHYYT